MVKNNQTMKKLFFQRSLKHQDIQGDIRHPVDYLVDLIETKVQSIAFFLRGSEWRDTWLLWDLREQIYNRDIIV